MTKKDLKPIEFDSYYWRYIDKLPEELKLRNSFELGKVAVTDVFNSIPSQKHNYSYANGKWTCKEVLQHLVDTERIFQYRCFRIARNDKTALAGFDQNTYTETSLASSKSMEQLITEFNMVRDCSISLVNGLTDKDLENIGTASGVNMSARAAAFTITGHEIWHMEILSERYL